MSFVLHDTMQQPILLEWQEIKGQTNELNQKIKGLVDILAPAYTKTELLFAQKHPEMVPNDFMLSFLAPLFQQENTPIDWKLVEQNIDAHLRQFLSTFDWKKGSHEHDIYIFVIAKDPKTNQNLGVIQFMQTADYKNDTFKAALYGILPTMQNRGIERLLMSSIFKIKPETKRIFLHTRSTNDHLIKMYTSWGFTIFDGPLPGWTDLEYFADKSEYLQKSMQ